ncbi:MAG TPA: ABC transporter ATP-binding protein [Pyrinomonadaceae bacterium]|jgi:ABC-2 type transport system ATP-binding protein
MISTSGLTKFYETHPAVREVSLFVPAGETCALVGPNGAGKTTLLKMLAGLLRPTSGKIEVGGVEVGAFPKRLHRVVGYVPDTFGLYDDLSVRHFLEYFARAHEVPRESAGRRIDGVLGLTNLAGKRDAQVGSLSRGMRQRLVIAKTLLHAPKVLLLDEPASGLDPHARFELRDIIRQLAALGKTVIVSSHILTELADFSTSVIIMERGRVARSGRIDALVEQLAGGTPVRVELLGPEAAARLAEGLRSRAGVEKIKPEGATLDFTFTGGRAELAALHRELTAAHDGLVSFYERRLTVEDVFLASGRRDVS